MSAKKLSVLSDNVPVKVAKPDKVGVVTQRVKLRQGQYVEFAVPGPRSIMFHRVGKNEYDVTVGPQKEEPKIVIPSSGIIIPAGSGR